MSTEYVCEVSGRKYKTAGGARKSTRREKLREYQLNYVRLNSRTVSEFLSLMSKKGKEFHDCDLDLDFISSGFDYWKSSKANIEEKTLRVEVGLRLKVNKRHNKRKKLHDYIQSHFCCVRMSYDWTDLESFSLCDNYKKVSFYLTLGDFPGLLKNYKTFLKQESDLYDFLETKMKATRDAKTFAQSRPEYEEMAKRKEEISNALLKNEKAMSETIKYYSEGYMRLWECSNRNCPEIDQDLEKTFNSTPGK